jgi:hypothetical protein
MLRACQRAGAQLKHVSDSSVRWFVAGIWPVEVPLPEGVKPFDPKGPLSQIDAYVEGLSINDPLVHTIKRIKDLRAAVEKMEDAQSSVRLAGSSKLCLGELVGRCFALACVRLGSNYTFLIFPLLAQHLRAAMRLLLR